MLPSDNPTPSESFDFTGMLLLSPGLALFLFGVSSIPEAGTIWSTRVLVSAAAGLALVVLFVLRTLFRSPEHPLMDLQLFRNRALSVSRHRDVAVRDRVLRGEPAVPVVLPPGARRDHPAAPGLLLAPQGLGAMLTMPAAGILTDRIGPGKIVLAGISVIVVGMAMFTQVDASDTLLRLPARSPCSSWAWAWAAR